MEDEGTVLLDGKALGNLRVVDLKQELEKRGLSKSGSKKDLVKRLKQQLEFEKLCGERKSTGDCDLKLELDADTEQNEFVQQYLAQQQKIYAEQKEVKRLIELGEIQKSGDERGSDSTKAEDASDHEAQDTSDNESQPEVFENVRESSSTQKSEKTGEVDSSKLEENVLKQEEIMKEAAVCEKIPSPIKDEEPKTEAEEVSKSNEEIVEIVAEETKSKESSNQIEPIENVETNDHKPEDKADDIEAESGKVNADEELNVENTVQETRLKTEVSNITDSSDVHSKSKDADEIHRDSIIEKNTNQSPEVKESKTDIFTPLDSSNESALKVQDVSVEPSGENVSSMQPSVSSETDKSSEKDQDLNMEPAAEVPPVPYALSENKENVMKHVSKPVCETKKGSHKNGTDSDSDSKSTASEKDSSESEEALNLNGKSTSKKLGRSTRKETDNQGGESKSNKSQRKDSASDKKAENESEKVDKTRSPTGTSKALQKSKSRKYSEEEIKSADSESGESSDSREHKRSQRRSRKGKRKMRHSSSDSSRSQSRDNSSVEKVEKMDDEEKSKVASGSVSESDDASRQKKSKLDTGKHNQGRQKSRKDKRKISQSGSSDSSRSRSRDSNSSAEKDEKMDTEDNLKVDAESVPESHDSNKEQKKLKPEARESRQKLREIKRKVSHSGSSDSSRSRSRDSSSSVERGEIIETKETSKDDSDLVSKSHDSTHEQVSEASEGKRGRRASKGSKRRSSRSRSSDRSRSQSRESGIIEEDEKIKSGDSFKADDGLDSKSKDEAIEVEKSKSETPPKKFKIKRDNVKVPEPSLASRKDSTEERTELKRKLPDAVVVETTEKDSPEPTKKIEVQPYVSTRKIRISGRKLSEKSEEPKIKRGKWGNFTSSQKQSQAISISTNSLKNLFPDFKLLKNPDVVNEAIEDMQVVSKEENNPEHQTEKIEESKNVPQNIDSHEEQVPEPVEQIDESEATNILFIQNLVRPFTLLQLKELLKETGQFIEEKFWIDKIKSKCFVTYTSVEEAIKTKTALNGTRWPSSNPKILSVEFSTEENLLFHQSGSELPKPLPPAPPIDIPESHEERSLEDFRRKEREPQDRRRERSKLQPVREWDKNKLTQESPPTRERVSKSVERSKSSDKKEKKDSKRRPNEDTPAKLLDDLFQKTKSSPCIYWLPLTEEQVTEREEARRLKRLEREKRIQQREQEEAEQKAKAAQSRNRTREVENRRSSTRSRSPVSRRR